MSTMKNLLRNLNVGNSVAEFDNALENYFVETDAFRSLVSDQADIIAGDKGTGKTALFKILKNRYTRIKELNDTEVIAAFNPAGSPVFKPLTQERTLNEGEYTEIWKSYFLSLAGNWLLDLYKDNFTASMPSLDEALGKLDLRVGDGTPAGIFNRIMEFIGHWFRPKSAQVEIRGTESGNPVFVPKIEFAGTNERDKKGRELFIEDTFRILNSCLDEAGISLWIVLDRLDEAFQGYPEVEVPALRALLRTYLDLLAFPRVRTKLFVRRDLFRKIIEGGFVNLTHINARKFEIIWDEDDLLNLLCRRIRENKEFCSISNLNETSDKKIFSTIFPLQVDVGKRKPGTYKWIMRRIRDGNDVKPPRNLIDLVSKAQQAQLRKEEREEREFSPDKPVIEADALRNALTLLSKERVQDTLLAEAGNAAPLIEKFRDGKAEHNEDSLAKILQIEPATVRIAVKPLIEMGFLEDFKITFKVPSLYREGLGITQGKGFDAPGKSDEEEDDE